MRGLFPTWGWLPLHLCFLESEGALVFSSWGWGRGQWPPSCDFLTRPVLDLAPNAPHQLLALYLGTSDLVGDFRTHPKSQPYTLP